MQRSKKRRIDQLLCELGLAENADAAQRMVMAGTVVAGTHRVDKPGTLIDPATPIRLKEQKQFVSRAGDKLRAALDAFPIDVSGRVALDIGASTGGFSDCLLQAGVARVYALDVGKGLLDIRLRRDPRVVTLEGVHARNLSKDLVPDAIDLATADVSFTSLRHVLPPVFKLMKNRGDLILLFKPQFEAPKNKVDTGGVVSDHQLRQDLLASFATWLKRQGLSIRQHIDSPVLGRKSGNVEMLLWVRFD
ncbi:MAG: TlyA family RNA methyltransferase [Acidobacteria bacterium]|nr:TlyA family RNA methyltransferase [Acidobacteriota bacterium]